MMETLTTWFHYLVDHPSTATLLIGGTLFAIVFLVFQMTKWGHENPVSKCVALSVFAHVILLAYAYTTNLITHVPMLSGPEPVPIRVADIPMDQVPSESSQATESPFWNQFSKDSADEAMAQTDLDSLESSVEVGAHLSGDDLTPNFAASLPELNDNQQPEISTPSRIAESDPVQEALKQSLQPRDTPAEALPNVEIAQASPQDSGMSESGNQLREPDQTRQQDSNWFDEQLTAEGPQRVESNSEPWQLADSQETPELENRFNETSNEIYEQDRVDRLVDNVNQATTPRVQNPEVVPVVSEALATVQLPRTAVDADRLVQGQRRLGDGQLLPARYQRRQSHPLPWLKEQGGSEETEAAIARSLAYLASVQQADGSWNPRTTDAGRELQVLGHNRQGAGAQADTGITGLALLAFLGAGNSHLEGPYRENVRRGLEYLIGRQQRNGSLAGSSQFFAQMYCHSMALLALSEAYSVSGDARMSDSVEKGVLFSVQAQNKNIGGWRYQPGDSGDMSQFGWQVLAINSAALSGQTVPAETAKLMKNFLQRHTQGTHGGLAIYRYGEDVSPVMTAEAMICRYLLNEAVTQEAAREAAAEILGRDTNGTHRNLPGSGVDNVYFWYYGTLALHQMAADPKNHDDQDVQQAWQSWNQRMKQRLLALQESHGANSGSWDSKWFMWGCYGGRVYSTAMSTMCLQVYYRYDLVAEERLRTAGIPNGPTVLPTPTIRGSLGDMYQR